jgi:hypothetical protein
MERYLNEYIEEDLDKNYPPDSPASGRIKKLLKIRMNDPDSKNNRKRKNRA